MKDTFKKYMKGAKQKDAEPRDLQTITQEYSQFAGRLGQAYYRKQVLEADISQMISQIAQLDREATIRRDLDAKNTPKESQNETVA